MTASTSTQSTLTPATSQKQKLAELPPPDPAAATTLATFLDIWSLSLFLAVLLAVGISPAVRGGLPGIDLWIEKLDGAAALTSQFVATLTFVLMIHLGGLGVRLARPLWLVLPAVFLGTPIAVLLIGAQSIVLGFLAQVVLLAATGALLLSSIPLVRRPRGGIRLVLGAAGLSLLSELARVSLVREAPELDLAPFFGLLRWLFGLLVVLVVLFRQYSSSRIGRLALPITLGVGLLASLFMSAASFSGASSWTVLLGRTLWGLSPLPTAHVPHAGVGFQLGIAVATLCWALASRFTPEKHESLQLLLAAIIALCVTVESSPMTACAIALAALGALVVSNLPLPNAESD